MYYSAGILPAWRWETNIPLYFHTVLAFQMDIIYSVYPYVPEVNL